MATKINDFELNEEDPFGYTTIRYANKAHLVKNRIPLDVISVAQRTSEKFGKDEWVVTVEYAEDNELQQCILTYAVGNAQGEVSNRDKATAAMMRGLANGRAYRGLYLTGNGKGVTFTSKLPPKSNVYEPGPESSTYTKKDDVPF